MKPSKKKPREVIESFYCSNNTENALDYQILGWESEEAQRRRFKVLTDNINLDGKSLLDVGCGLGNLLSYFKEVGIQCKYTGADILESMTKAAGERNPDGEFLYVDVFNSENFSDRKFDVVFTSGIFNLSLDNNMKFLEKAIKRFMELANQQVMFNLLHIRSTDKGSGFFYYNPEKVMTILHKLHIGAERIKLIDDYLPNDFSVIINMQ